MVQMALQMVENWASQIKDELPEPRRGPLGETLTRNVPLGPVG